MTEFKGFKYTKNNKEKKSYIDRPKLKDPSKSPFAGLDKLKSAKLRQKRMVALKNKPPKYEVLKPTETKTEGIFEVESYITKLEDSREQVDFWKVPHIYDEYWSTSNDNYSLKLHHHTISGIHEDNITGMINSFGEQNCENQETFKSYAEFKIINKVTGDVVNEFGPKEYFSKQMWDYNKYHLKNEIISIDELVALIEQSYEAGGSINNDTFKERRHSLIKEKKAKKILNEFSKNHIYSSPYQGYSLGGISIAKVINYWLSKLTNPNENQKNKINNWIDKYYNAITKDFLECVKQEGLKVSEYLKAKKEIPKNYDPAGKLDGSSFLEIDGRIYSNQMTYLSKSPSDFFQYPEDYILRQMGIDFKQKGCALDYIDEFYALVTNYEFPSFGNQRIFDDVTNGYFKWEEFYNEIVRSGLMTKFEFNERITNEDSQFISKLFKSCFDSAEFNHGRYLGID
ncbi:MAG: hypothetical protein AAGF07_02700 [Patescibacteria group bacterium]